MRENGDCPEKFLKRVRTLTENARMRLLDEEYKEYLLKAEELIKNMRYEYKGV